MNRILCIRLPRWPIQRLAAALDATPSTTEAIAQRPIVLHEMVRGQQRVAACSAQAAALGVRAGMPVAEVLAAFPDAQRQWPPASRGSPRVDSRRAMLVLPHEPEADRAALEQWAVACEPFSPLVGIEQTFAPDSLLLDIGGLEHLFGSEAKLAAQIIELFAARRLTVFLATAQTVGAAWAVAHYGQDDRHAGQRGEVSAHVAASPEWLSALPLAALRLPAEMIDLLRQLGLQRIGQLESLPRGELALRFGDLILTRLDQFFGRMAEPIVSHRSPAEMHAECALEYPTARCDAIEAFVERLLRQIGRQLDARGHGALALQCRLDCRATTGVDAEAFRPQTVRFNVGLFEPSASPDHLRGLVALEFERLTLPGPVVGLTISAAPTAPIHHRQQSLFSDEPRPPTRRRLAALVERLSGRLGPRQVLAVRLAHEALPELAWCGAPLVGGAPRSQGRAFAALPPRPVKLFPQPIRLQATAVAPEGPPIQFDHDGNRHRIVRAWGPERIETGWWRGRMAARDYYRVETAAGSRFWLFRQRGDGRWFLHGAFE